MPISSDDSLLVELERLKQRAQTAIERSREVLDHALRVEARQAGPIEPKDQESTNPDR